MSEVLFVDNHILLLKKPAGMLTQPDDSDCESLEAFGKAWIKREFQKPGNVFLHAVHRLDKPVSGLVLFARTSKALSRLNQFQREHRFQKEYIALVEGHLMQEEGILEHYLQKKSFRAEIAERESPGSKKCLLKYNLLRAGGRTSLLKISLMTGRYHQIRAQLSAIGHPIVGDLKYGSREASKILFLHHSKLSFPHPVSQEVLQYEVPVPW